MMAKRFYSFIVVFLLIFPSPIISQQERIENNIKKTKSQLVTLLSGNQLTSGIQGTVFREKIIFKNFFHTSRLTVPFDQSSEKMYKIMPVVLTPVPISFYSTHIGFICQQESKLEKWSPVPFRFRLGSPEYVNWMEQKPNAVRPAQ
jgi:hypothetical protein